MDPHAFDQSLHSVYPCEFSQIIFQIKLILFQLQLTNICYI